MAAPFVDTAKITVRSGNGGNGVVSFTGRSTWRPAARRGRRRPGRQRGGGGRRPHVHPHDFRYKRKYVAENGMDGSGKRCTGKNGTDLVLKVPRGTVIRDAETQEIIQDISGDEPFILCKGGRGGWGNQHFATPTRQVPASPRRATPARPGRSFWN